ncbi:hypothetical protein E4T51_01111 [Aureobasidium sp. EXF-12344]|nr:hypothetical protein E4T51_01111 [Aureobasidium sp. EXF-12344]
MVPRLRQRVCLETLRRELQLVDVSAPSPSPSLAVKDSWKGSFRVEIDDNCDFATTDSQVVSVGDKIPGFRTSAAFFTSLRTNLHLGVSPPPSPMSTPPSMRASASSIGPPSPLQNAVDNGSDIPEGPLTGVPDLKTYVAETEEDKIAALKLVADSIAQMRQTANRILMFNPFNLAAFIAFLAVVSQYLIKSRSDIGIMFTTSAGILMAAMVTIRRFTNPYIALAEEVHISMLEDADVLVTKYGNEVIGTVILGWVDAETKGKRRKWRAEIKGWAVRIRYRGKGEGIALLQEAVNLARKKDADGILFAPDHANSKRVLWDFYNGPFEKKEKKAAAKLQALWDNNAKSNTKSKRR